MKPLLILFLAVLFSCSGEDPGPDCAEYQRRVDKYESQWIAAQKLVQGDFTTPEQWEQYNQAKADYDLAMEEYDYNCLH